MIYNCFFFSKWVALFQILNFFATKTTKIYLKCFNGKLWPYHLSCFINSFLYDPACKLWLFEKFIFELEASYSFKMVCILVRQVRHLKKIGGVFSKIYCLVSWSPVCTPLILLSTLMKIASTSTTVIIVCTPPLSAGGEGWASNQIFKKGGTWQDLNF